MKGLEIYFLLGMTYSLFSIYAIKDTDEYKNMSNNTICIILFILTMALMWPFIIGEIIVKIIKKILTK